MKIANLITSAILTLSLGCDQPEDEPTCSEWLSCYEECLVVPNPSNLNEYATMPIENSVIECAAVCGEETDWKYKSWDPAAAPCDLTPEGAIYPIEQLVAACDVKFSRAFVDSEQLCDDDYFSLECLQARGHVQASAVQSIGRRAECAKF